MILLVPLPLKAEGVSLSNTKDLNKEFESDIKNIIGEKGSINIPSLSGADFGALENNETSLYLESIDYKYSIKAPKHIVDFVNDKTKHIVGQKINIKDLVKFLKQLEKDFVMIGYPMVRVVFPAQSFEAKKAKTVVYIISGIIENIVIENDKKEDRNVEQAILNILEPLKNKEYIDVKTINEKMLILKGLYGLSSKIFLSRGKNQGGFIVNVKVSYKDKQFLTSIKNNLNARYGSYSIQMMKINNFVKNDVGQSLKIIPSFSLKQTSNTYYRSLTLLYNRYYITGSSIEMSLLQSISSSITSNNYNSYSQNRNIGVMYTKPLILNYSEQSYVSAGVQYTNNTMKNKNTNTYQYKDTIAEATLVGEHTIKTTQGVHKTKFSLNKSINDLGAKYNTINGISSSRSGVTGSASRLIGSYKFLKDLLSREKFKFVFNFQYTFNNPVLSSQQYSATGFEKVQGLIGDGFTGDEGYSVYAEYNFKPEVIKGNIFTPFLSASFSKLYRKNPTSVESKNVSARSISGGVSVLLVSNTLLKASLNYTEKHGMKSVYDKSIGLSLIKQF